MRRPPRDENGREIAAPSSVSPDLGKKRLSEGEPSEMIRQVRAYELITPLYGGGVDPAHADPLTVVRVPSIRGQLRFWWRAMRAAQFHSVTEMKSAEDALWGSTERSSAVVIELKSGDATKPERETAYRVEHNPQKNKFETKPSAKIAPYAAFPLQPEESERKQANWKSEDVLLGVRFSLLLNYPRRVANDNQGRQLDVEREVAAALWAWETFGGVGARTRRGFGALRLLSINGSDVHLPQSDALEAHITGGLSEHLASGQAPRNVPHLIRESAFRLTPRAQDPGTAWKNLIQKLRDFRQYRKDKNTGNLSAYGKSQWPEPDAIRRLTGKRSGVEVEKFPRAEFGLPIIFHMPHDDLKPTLKGAGDVGGGKPLERLASPLILRPIQCADGAVGLAAVLESPRVPPDGLLLTGLREEHKVRSDISADEARRLSRRLEPLGNRTDVLQAFLDYLTVRRPQRT